MRAVVSRYGQVQPSSTQHSEKGFDGGVPLGAQGAVKAFARNARTLCHCGHALRFGNVA